MKFFDYEIDPENLPQHVGIIMDGNGRWAKERGQKRVFGHEQGFKALKELMDFNRELGVPAVTVYAFSTENWRRPESEVGYLMNMLVRIIPQYSDELLKNDIQLRVTGTKKSVDPKVWEKIQSAIDKTAQCSSYIFNVAFNYGGRQEIMDAVCRIIEDVKSGAISEKELNEERFSHYLYQSDLPDADLIIRTSGEERLSNFLLWQSAYSEFYFTDTLWPDFSPEEFCKAISEFQHRKRRFGKV